MQHKINADRSKSRKNGFVGMNLSIWDIYFTPASVLVMSCYWWAYVFVQVNLCLETEYSKVHQVGYFK